jgi:hypothetical protein
LTFRGDFSVWEIVSPVVSQFRDSRQIAWDSAIVSPVVRQLPEPWAAIGVEPSWLAGGDGAHSAEGVACSEGFLDEGEESACRVAGDDLLRVQQDTQTVCPLKTGFLARRMGRPKCSSIWR